MPLDVLHHATFTWPAFPEPFVRFELEKELTNRKLLPKTTGDEGRELQDSWAIYRRKLRELVSRGGAIRVRNHIFDPLVTRLGYERIEEAPEMDFGHSFECLQKVFSAPNSTLRRWGVPSSVSVPHPSSRSCAGGSGPSLIS